MCVLAELEAMVPALVRAVRAAAEAQALAEHGRRMVLETYEWDMLALKLKTSWKCCLARKGPPCTSCT
jgi:hypothetical protein